MRFTDQELVAAGRAAETKNHAAIDVMTRPEAKYALKNSVPAAMLHRLLAQLPDGWVDVKEGLPPPRQEVLIGYWGVDPWRQGDTWVWYSSVGFLVPDSHPAFKGTGGLRWHTGAMCCGHSQIQAWHELPVSPVRFKPS